MNALLIASVVISMALQSVSRKSYQKKTSGKGSCIFNVIACLTAAVFFWVSGGFEFDMNPAVIPYSIGFAATYGTTVYCGFLALMYGPLSLTSLISGYSLMVPTLYGLVFMNEPISVYLIIGLVFLALSLFFIAIKKEEKQISARWVVLVILSLLGNGICSTILSVQQINFEGAYKNEFMIMALILLVIFLSVVTYRREKREIKESLKVGIGWMVLWGVLNGATNLFVMMLATRVPASIMYPLISGFGLILSWLMSRFLYKEKLTPLQNLGFVFGIFAVIFLNL